jgi:uncharacterized protein (TIGR00661 family)
LPLFKKINSPAPRRPLVLISPLDWGLGHATRCVPVIKVLLALNCEVVIASSGPQKKLLIEEFPNLRFVELEGYNIKYGTTAVGTFLRMIFQVPGILRTIRKENAWLNNFAKSEKIDLIISDNRYGLHHETIPSIFITHQLRIKTAMGQLADGSLQKLNYSYIRRFTECWIPDAEGQHNLAGELSHPSLLPPVPIKYLGPLSRFRQINGSTPNGDLLIILSGPEPQRTILENILLTELITGCQRSTILIRGLPGKNQLPGDEYAMLKVFNHLPSSELNDLVNSARIIISRSGYSTVMDLLPLGKKCIFIPTPGQPEQAYLATYFQSRRLALSFPQYSFSLSKAMTEAEKFEPQAFERSDTNLLKNIASNVLQSL